MQQHFEIMSPGNLVHQVHEQLVVVNSKIYFFKHRSTFKLAGCNFIVTGFEWDTQFECFNFKFHHKSIYTRRDRSEIMIFELLAFGGNMPEYCSAGSLQVRPCIVHSNINQE